MRTSCVFEDPKGVGDAHVGDEVIDCVVVGGGAAGLAASVALAARGVQHVVLEADRAAQTWQTQRWQSFQLNTPGWTTTQLLGEQPRDSYLTADEVCTRLGTLAARAPIRERVRVVQLAPADTGYVLRTPDEEISARTVVVATGDENVPRLPPITAAVPAMIAQLHSAEYRTPDRLPEGIVLVVGSGQSGAQISEDLLAGGRRVLLATSPVGRVPVRHRGLNTFDLLHAAGFFDQTPADLPDPAMIHVPQPILAPGGRALSLQMLARAGATLTGRMVAVQNGRVRFDDSATANIAVGDQFAGRVSAMLDELIVRSGRSASPGAPGDSEVPVALDPPSSIELGQIGAIVWCTGFTGDFSWLSSTLLDARGRPRHTGTAGPVPGLWYVGLRWLTHRGSATLPGIPRDAATVATEVAAHLDATSGSR
jgi:putative flavoprotein involved in K+ transport